MYSHLHTHDMYRNVVIHFENKAKPCKRRYCVKKNIRSLREQDIKAATNPNTKASILTRRKNISIKIEIIPFREEKQRGK